MKNLSEILFQGKERDVMLIQPHFLLRVLSQNQNKIVIEYWNSLNNQEPMGDFVNEPNHGLYSLAASVLQSGYTVEVLDFHTLDMVLRDKENRMIEYSDIEESIIKNKSKIYGISCITVTVDATLKIAEMIKKYHPDSLVVVGGIHPTINSQEMLKNRNIDIVIKGEGNIAIVELINCTKDSSDFDDIKGICYKDKNGNYVETHKRSCHDIDLDELPYPAYDLCSYESLPLMPRVFSSKGCPNGCAFCTCDSYFKTSYDDYKIQFRDPVKVVDEIEHLHKKYNIDFFDFGDLTFMVDKKRAHQLCNLLIERKLNHLRWWCQTTVGRLDAEDLALMRKAGCAQISMGIENSSQEVLDVMDKPVDFEKAINQCKLIRDADIQPVGYWLFGLGDETFEGANRLIQTICYFIENELNEITHIGIPVPYPGSPLYKSPEKFGYTIINHDFSNYWMNSDPLGYGTPNFRTTNLSEDHIYALWQYALMAATEKYKERNRRRMANKLNTLNHGGKSR
ncbi:B12-binding domain-containing radical SAM protein [Aminipila terrae]|uniref:Radical SAM protein n=1 Tax=Aminipila terrae TaxID=2697030 RepID=A0A6P1MHH6_9FIRM|nr:radical SAM protein [Aminipila terrae]QHI71036.1 radical SAM protein [Aminipila terrae]